LARDRSGRSAAQEKAPPKRGWRVDMRRGMPCPPSGQLAGCPDSSGAAPRCASRTRAARTRPARVLHINTTDDVPPDTT
jgi:hypothetical protein